MTETNLYVTRMIFTDESTISDAFWQGSEFECSFLEDTCRKRDLNNDGKLEAGEKVYAQTAIPAGRYEIKMEFSPHFQRLMPHLQNVPLFDCVMIHWGNKPADVKGCLATGDRDINHPDWVSRSQKTFNELEPKILAALAKGQMFINIEGGYHA